MGQTMLGSPAVRGAHQIVVVRPAGLVNVQAGSTYDPGSQLVLSYSGTPNMVRNRCRPALAPPAVERLRLSHS